MDSKKEYIKSPFDFGKRKVMTVRVPDKEMTKEELREAWLSEHPACPIDKFYTIKGDRKLKIYMCERHGDTLIEEEHSVIVT